MDANEIIALVRQGVDFGAMAEIRTLIDELQRERQLCQDNADAGRFFISENKRLKEEKREALEIIRLLARLTQDEDWEQPELKKIADWLAQELTK